MAMPTPCPSFRWENSFFAHSLVLVGLSAYFLLLIFNGPINAQIQSMGKGYTEFLNVLHISTRHEDPRCFLYLVIWPSLPLLLLLVECYMRQILHGETLANMTSTESANLMKNVKDNIWWRVVASIAFIVMATLVSFIVCAVRSEFLLAQIWIGLPLAVISLRTLLLTFVCLDGVIATTSENDIDEYLAMLERDGTPKDWLACIKSHFRLDTRLEKLWREVSLVLIIGAPAVGLLILSSILAGTIAWEYHRYLHSFGNFFMMTLIGSIALVVLQPLAHITSLCQSCKNGERSIINKALEHGCDKMSCKSRCEYETFVLHLRRTLIGAELLLLGAVDYAFLVSKLITLASMIPVVLTLMAGLAGSK